MRRKDYIFLLGLVWVLLVAYAVAQYSTKQTNYERLQNRNAIAAAFSIYKKAISEGMDVSNGPCLTNDLMPGWVVDIVHSPRDPRDDLPVNQCAAFVEGRAQHFVELDVSGNLIRVR